MKSVIATLSMIAAGIMFTLSIVLFLSNSGTAPINREYGGDAYTGIQNAAAATARNVVYTNKLMRVGFGAVSVAAGFAFLLVSLYFNEQYRKERAAEEAKRVLPSFYPAPTPTPTSTPSAPAGVMKDGWLCTCGKMNPQYMSSCTCGKTAREIREMNKPQ